MGGRLGTTVVLVGCALLVLTQLYASIPLAPVVDAAFGTRGADAALGTAFGVPYAVGFLVLGPLSDRFGRKPVLVPGVAVAALATAAVATAPTLAALAALRAVQGFASASFSAVALAYVTESFPPRWAAGTLGAVSTAYLVAGIGGQVYADLVAHTLGWRWAFGLGAAALGATALALAAVLREPVRPSGAGATGAARRLGTLVTRPEFALLCAAALPVLMCFVAMYAAMGPALVERFGLDGSDPGLVRLAGLPAMALAPFAGLAGDRFGPARTAVAGLCAAATGMLVQAFAASGASVVAGCVLVVAGIATAAPNHIALCGARAGDARASGIALNGCVLFVGASLGQPLASMPLAYPGLLALLAALLLGSATLVVLSARYGRRAVSRAV